MKIKIFITGFLFTSLLFAIPAFAQNATILSQDQINEAQKNLLAEYDKQLAKEVRILPGSKIYFLKRIKEFLEGNSNLGNWKTTYLLKVSNERLKEAYLLIRKNKTDLAEKTLSDYSRLLKKLKKRNLKNQRGALVESTSMLKRISALDGADEGELDKTIGDALNQTALLLGRAQQQALIIEKRDWVEGKVVEKNPYFVALSWDKKTVLVSNFIQAQFVDKSGQKTNQGAGDINEGAVIAVAPKDKQITFSIDSLNQGYLTAEKIVIGGMK